MIDLDLFGLTETEKSGVLAARERLSPEARRLIEEGAAAYEASPDFDYLSFAERLGEGPAPEEAQFQFLLALLPALRTYCEERGRPERYFLGVLRDLRIKLRECHAMRGVYGTFVVKWFRRWFTLERIALERLQVECIPYDYTLALPGFSCAPGDLLVNVHIPGEGPLDRAACERDYAEAASLFGEKFPGDFVPFHCHSWLLNPDHPAFLDSRSRLLAFQADYAIFAFEREEPERFIWRLTLTPYDGDPAHLPERNSLERAYKARILSGGAVGEGRGIYLYPKRKTGET